MKPLRERTIIEREFAAWVRCIHHNDINDHPQIKCGYCHGEGGKWNSYVHWSSGGWKAIFPVQGESFPVTQSSILVERGKQCGECNGVGMRHMKKGHCADYCPTCNGSGLVDTEWSVKDE